MANLDNFFAEIKDPKQTVIYGVLADLGSLFILPFALYSIGMLMGIYGAYHSFRQKKWLFLLANVFVSVLAIYIKLNFHKS